MQIIKSLRRNIINSKEWYTKKIEELEKEATSILGDTMLHTFSALPEDKLKDFFLNKMDSDELFKSELPLDYKILKEKMNKKFSRVSKGLEEYKKYIIWFDEVLAIYGEDGITKQIDSLFWLVIMLKSFYPAYEFDLNLFSQYLGMAIYYDYKLIIEDRATEKLENTDIIRELGIYYNEDGTFKYVEDIAKYRYLIEKLENITTTDIVSNFSSNKKMEHFCVNNLPQLLEESNKKHLNIQPNIVAIGVLDYNPIEYINNFYQNGKVINIPDDMEKFNEAIKYAKISEKEKQKILTLVNRKISFYQNDIIAKYLKGNDLVIYEEALELLTNPSLDDKLSAKIFNLISELKVIIEFLNEDNNEFINEKDDVIIKLNRFLNYNSRLK